MAKMGLWLVVVALECVSATKTANCALKRKCGFLDGLKGLVDLHAFMEILRRRGSDVNFVNFAKAEIYVRLPN